MHLFFLIFLNTVVFHYKLNFAHCYYCVKLRVCGVIGGGSFDFMIVRDKGREGVKVYQHVRDVIHS